MADSPFAGAWTYRSLHNRPQDVEDFNELRLAQAELTLQAVGPDLLSGRLSFGEDFLVMSATVQDSEPQTVRMRGTGVEGTPTAGWIYDYVGYLAPSWPDGDSQRPAIVGTVIRTAPHEPQRPAGHSYSFVAVSRDRPADPYRLPELVTDHFADRLHRLHHSVWHGLRNTWDVVTQARRDRIRALGWEPPRPARQYVRGVFKRPRMTNGSGEDFLFFHREMVVQYRALMTEAGQPPIDWIEIPQPGNRTPGNDVPPAWSIPAAPPLERRIAALKSDGFYWSRMRWWDQQFKDPTYLATLTLGELGALLEFAVHNDMHMRWSSLPRDPDTNAALPLGRPDADFSSRWDNPRYDALLEFYSSHVHPVFWRLHGWIDDRIDDWFEAHERVHPGEIAPEPHGAVRWFKPGPWVGVTDPWVWPAEFSGPGHGRHSSGGHGGGHHVDPQDRERRIASMEEVLSILYEPEPGLAAVPGAAAEYPVAFDPALKLPV